MKGLRHHHYEVFYMFISYRMILSVALTIMVFKRRHSSSQILPVAYNTKSTNIYLTVGFQAELIYFYHHNISWSILYTWNMIQVIICKDFFPHFVSFQLAVCLGMLWPRYKRKCLPSVSCLDVLPFSIPAICYAINNNLAFYMQSQMDPTTYMVGEYDISVLWF